MGQQWAASSHVTAIWREGQHPWGGAEHLNLCLPPAGALRLLPPCPTLWPYSIFHQWVFTMSVQCSLPLLEVSQECKNLRWTLYYGYFPICICFSTLDTHISVQGEVTFSTLEIRSMRTNTNNNNNYFYYHHLLDASQMHSPVLSSVMISSFTHHKCHGILSSSFYR